MINMKIKHWCRECGGEWFDEIDVVRDKCPKCNVEAQICPTCNKPFFEYPALSRKDNKTHICSQCGQEEAMVSFSMNSIK